MPRVDAENEFVTVSRTVKSPHSSVEQCIIGLGVSLNVGGNTISRYESWTINNIFLLFSSSPGNPAASDSRSFSLTTYRQYIVAESPWLKFYCVRDGTPSFAAADL